MMTQAEINAHYEKEYPATLKLMRKHEGRKFCNVSKLERIAMMKAMRWENPEIITIAAAYDSFDYAIAGQVVRTTPKDYLKILIDVLDNSDSVAVRDNFIDYQIKICRSALSDALEDLWDSVMESDEDIDESANERALFARQEYDIERRMAA